MRRVVSVFLAFVLMVSFFTFAESSSWMCLKCGTANTGKYCSECGTSMAQATYTCEGIGYETPQEAAIAYVEAINEGDSQGAISTFAIETLVDHIDAEAINNRIQAVIITGYQGIPIAGPFSRGLLIEQRRAEIARGLFYMYIYYSTLGTDYSTLGEGKPLRFVNDEPAAAAFTDYMRNSSFESFVGKISIQDAYLPSDSAVDKYVPDVYSSDRNQENIDRIRKCVNGEKLQDVLVLLDINGIAYMQCMQCICYDGRWYNYSAISNIALILGLDNMSNGLVRIADISR